MDALKEGNYHFLDRDRMEPREALLAAYDADIFLSSVNAMTDDGILLNIDGLANRVSCIAQGPRKVIFLVGMNYKSPDTICCQFLMTRFSRHKDRIHVILVNDDLGF